jgi:multiple sugar transport system substrate-binding protein
MQVRAILLAATLMLAPSGARAADLVVWWEKGFNPEEDQAAAELVAAFEKSTSQRVELAFYALAELPKKLVAALETGRPPDFAFGQPTVNYFSQWAYEGRLVDLSEAIGPHADLFDPEVLARAMLRDPRTGREVFYGLPMGRSTNHLHVWTSLLERAGFTRADIPKEWEPFWSFWCDKVQPAARRALGRDDVWGIGLAMSVEANDTWFQFLQFATAYRADYVTPDGRLVLDDPEVRRGLVEAIDRYTSIYRRGWAPPDAVTWVDIDNNRRLQAQVVVMTPNETLSAVNAIKRERPKLGFARFVTGVGVKRRSRRSFRWRRSRVLR